jgi:MFS family permease
LRGSRLLINRNYARLWYGEAGSTLGDFVFNTTLVLWVATVLGKGQRWAPAAVSGVLVATGVAFLAVGPLAGVSVDRWNRRRTMLRSEVVRAILVGALTLLFLLPARDLPAWLWLTVIYLVVFVLNAAGQFFNPARLVIIAEVVPGDNDRARAAGIGQATYATASIVGPPLAAPLLFSVGVQWALALNALSYVVSWVAIRSIRPPAAAAAAEAAADETARAAGPAEQVAGAAVRGLRAELADGLRFFARSRFLVALVVVVMIAALGTGALNTLNVFFVTRNLHAAPRLYGFISTAFGIGAIAGSLLAVPAVRLAGARRLTCLGLLAGGALIFAYAQQDTFAGGLILLAAASVPVAMLNTALTPLLLSAAPPAYLGRVMAVVNPAGQLASMVSVLAAGWLASTVLPGLDVSFAGLHFGPVSVILAAAGLLIALAGVYAYVALPRPAATPAAAPAQAG